jgi:glycosyltransferase involved in cell wall biosynthesis
MNTIKENPFKTLIIIPAYNEEGSIESTVNSLSKSTLIIDYLVVNDGSKDCTLSILVNTKLNHLNLPVNIGLPGAVQAGLLYAEAKDYDCAIQFDGDGQHKAEFLPKIIEAIKKNECDVAIGSRFVTQKKPFSFRMLGSRLISLAIYLLTRHKINDPTSGMRAYNKSIIKLMTKNSNLGPEPDTIAYLIKLDKRVKEYQVDMDDRATGVSYLNFFASIKYMSRMMVSIIFINPFR